MKSFFIDYDEKKIQEAEYALKENIINTNNIDLKEADRPTFLIKQLNDITFDASRHQISLNTLKKAHSLAKLMGVNEWVEAIFNGEIVNKTEGKPALHAALRTTRFKLFSSNITKEVMEQRNKLFSFAEKIRKGELLSSNGKPYSSVIAIGIGGSDLGPRMAVKALSPFADGPEIRFVSNIDPAELKYATKNLNPSTTLLIVSSKTFKTIETLSNASAALNWMSKEIGEESAKKQRIAITSKVENAIEADFKKEQILYFSDWVGGRTSIWSSVGLPIVLSIGLENFEGFLDGGNIIDKHINENVQNSIPCLMALLGYIQRKYFNSSTQAIIPYDSNLSLLPSYLQQLEMESNGKGVSMEGKFLSDPCVPVIWGASGTDAQHSFFQMLHQGLEKIPIDILLARTPSLDFNDSNTIKRHRILAANALAQCEALSKGRKSEVPHKNFIGDRSVTLMTYNRLTPSMLGSIIAIYEYKVCIQAAMWRINPFDQFGVELGKELAEALLSGNESKAGMENGALEKLLKVIPSNIK